MKHKILIAVERGIHGGEFLSQVKTLLNDSHQKLLTGISISNYLGKKLVSAKSERLAKKPARVNVEDLEYQIDLERMSRKLGMEFTMYRESISDSSLRNLSTVADLMVIDRKGLQQFCGDDILSDLVEAVTCPVLILPETKTIDSLVMLHDGSLSAVKSVKQFLGIFDASLRKLPVSVLVGEPESKQAIEAEKVFIDYIKLFFGDIGIKLMDEAPVECLKKEVKTASGNPMVITGKLGGEEILNCTPENRIITDTAPTFIFKNRA